MEDKIVKDHKGKTLPGDTARVGGAAYAPNDHEAEKLAEIKGDKRTSEKTIGESSKRRDRTNTKRRVSNDSVGGEHWRRWETSRPSSH
jgi:hypothetical protein